MARRWCRPPVAVAALLGGGQVAWWGHDLPFFAPGRGDHRPGPELPRARAPRLRSGRRGLARRCGGRPAGLRAGHGRGRSWRWRSSSRSGSGCSSGRAPCSSTRSRSRPRSSSRSRCPPARSRSRATLDALTGGLIALGGGRGPASRRPERKLLREAARPVLEDSPPRSRTSPGRCASRDPAAAEAGLIRGPRHRRVGRPLLRAPPGESRETTRISPARRRARGTVEFYAGAAERIDLAVRNVRVLARGAMRALALDENVPPEVAGALQDLASAGCARSADSARARGGLRRRPRPSPSRRGDGLTGPREHGEPVGRA